MKTNNRRSDMRIPTLIFAGLMAATVAWAACTGMVPTPCGENSHTETPTQCMNGNQGTIVVDASYNSPSQCGAAETGGKDCSGQTNQVACIKHYVSYLIGCGSFINYQSTYTTNLIAQTTPGGGACPPAGG